MAWTITSRTETSHGPPREGDDRAVSPVIGMILVLGVSVVGVVAVLYWGVPAIADMKSDAEFRSVVNQFESLEDNMDTLSRGTPGETAKRWQPAFKRGGLTFDGSQERWVVGTDLVSGHNWSLAGVYDTDNEFEIVNDGTSTTMTVDAWTVDAGVETPLNVSDASDCSSTSDTDDMSSQTLAADASLTLCLYTEDGEIRDLENGTFKFEVVDEDSADTVARFYLVDVGYVRYTMTLGPSQRDAYLTNGAIVDGEPDDLDVRSDPAFGPPRDAGSSTRFFGRLVEVDGEGSFGGSNADRYSLLLSLYSTDTLLDVSDTVSLKVWIDGDTDDTWYDYYLVDADDHEFDEVDDGDVPRYLEYKPSDTFDLKILQSIIDLQVT